MTKKKDDGPGSAEGKADAGAAPAPDSQDLDENQKPNPPTHKVAPPPSIDELNAEMDRKVEVEKSIKDERDRAHDVVPEGAPVWEGGDPGVATKTQDDAPDDYYWPGSSGDAKEPVDPKVDGNGDGVEDGVVLDEPVNALVGPGEPDPETLEDGPDTRREHWKDSKAKENPEQYLMPEDTKIVPAVDLGIKGEESEERVIVDDEEAD